MSTKNKIAAIVLGAGQGTRMKSSKPKVMHEIASRPMVSHLIATLEKVGVEKMTVVIGPSMDCIKDEVAPYTTAVQEKQLGTANAVMSAKGELDGFVGDVIIAYGDSPLVTEETFSKMIEKRNQGASVVVLGFTPIDAGKYGRLVVKAGELDKIVEFKDANEAERAIKLCNSGFMCVDGSILFDMLAKVKNNNAAGEYYLTDIVEIAKSMGLKCGVVEGSEEEFMGANSRSDLAKVEAIVQNRLREKIMDNGVTLINPETVTFAYDTEIANDVVIEPFVVFGKGVKVASNVTIRAFSHLEGATIGAHAEVGPYARLRPQAVLSEGAKIGNFVEIKKSNIGVGTKVNHLTYIGDADVGDKTNVGAGTITCNYDGYNKSRTIIGKDVFVGSNTCFVAPVTVGDGAMTGAGSVITSNVNSDALAISRAKQRDIDGFAPKFRAEKKAEKEAKKLSK